MPSSWSDLPLDLLTSIINKLQLSEDFDFRSFRSVCSQWCSVVPVPNPFPCYKVEYDNDNNIIHLAIDNYSRSSRDHYISLPFSSSSPINLIGSSNGWLAFVARKNESLHLFDPVSNRKLIFPPLYPKMLLYYKKVKPIAHDACRLNLKKVVVSSSIYSGIAVAGIVRISRQIFEQETRFVFCRHAYDDCQRWSLLMEGSNEIRDIAFAGDGRFYAIGCKYELYMLDERPPLIRLRRVKLWLPKHILGIDHDEDVVKTVLATCSNKLTESGETDLIIYGPYFGHNDEINRISLKINVAKLRVNSNNINVACDAELSYSYDPYNFEAEDPRRKHYFTPSITEEHNSKLKCQM